MRIVIDALAVLPGINGGAATYIGGVVNALAESSAVHQFLVLATAATRHLFAKNSANFTVRLVRTPRGRLFRLLYEQLVLPLAAARWKADVVFFPGNMSSLLLPYFKVPSVVTIHDGSPAYYRRYLPQYFPRWKAIIQRFLARQAARNAAFVLTDSEFARSEVAAYTGVPASQILVVPPGCPRVQPPDSDVDALARQYGFQRPYLFMLGGSNKHKNYDITISAFAKVKEKLGLPHHMVLAGPRGNGYDDVVRAIRSAGAGPYVHLLGYVPSGHLSTLYHYADWFVMPSLYEGFGFPLLEAMELGVPVLSSSSASLPEVGADAAFYYDATNADEMAEAMALALTSPGLRSTFGAKGRARSAQFSWGGMARELLVCCARACAQTPPIPKVARAEDQYAAPEHAQRRSGGGPDV